MKNYVTKPPGLAAIADEIIDKPELAHRLKVCIRTVEQRMADGTIPFFRIGGAVRFRWAAVVAQLEDKCRIN